MRLKHKVILVTAATRGIGLACVRACAEEGGLVYLAARNVQRGWEIAEELQRQGAQVRCVYFDAAQPQCIPDMLETVVQEAGRLDVLVNNYGMSDPKEDLDFANTAPSVFLKTVQLNLQSVFLASQAAVRKMRGHGGSIINISSVSGVVPDVSQVAYGTSKAAINYLTQLIAVQEARRQIRCNAVLPGMTATEAVQKNLSGEFRQQFLRQIPLGRMGMPEEVASAVVFLASEESAYITGQLLSVSGGFGQATPLYGDLAEKQVQR